MRVFALLPQSDWRQTGPAAQAAEAAGFDAVMTVELGHDWYAPLAFAALATQRVELTPSVAVAFPRSPTVLASQAWDLHANSGGRCVLGLGSQVKGHNERRFGIAWTPPAPRLRDYVRALQQSARIEFAWFSVWAKALRFWVILVSVQEHEEVLRERAATVVIVCEFVNG